ncbi:hypothetical protein [Burkholderia ubonensis]|uniref:hypothetical protein n=1 Tax=Burkholderia ubonensis TaxID=101571 RepID=UPI0018DFE81F
MIRIDSIVTIGDALDARDFSRIDSFLGKLKIQTMLKKIVALMLVLFALAGCDALSSVPTYSGLSVEGFNYMPFNLTRFVIRDQYGNTASGGGDLPPGSGEGSLSCCYKLRGTDFTVDWEIYDQDKFMDHPYDPIKKIKKNSSVKLPPTKISGGAGEVVLAVLTCSPRLVR